MCLNPRGVDCKDKVDDCFEDNREIFTGLWAEGGSPANNKRWNGFGTLGREYQAAGLCLLRDLKFTPISKSLSVKTLVGDASVNQEIGFLSFDEKNGIMEGYHRVSATAPVIARKIDLFNQRFRFKAVSTDVHTLGYHVGAYDVYESLGLDLWAEGLNQSMTVELPVMEITTPYGSVKPKPSFRFAKSVGLIGSPYAGNNAQSLLSTPYPPDTLATDITNLHDGLMFTTRNSSSRGEAKRVGKPAGHGRTRPGPKFTHLEPTQSVSSRPA